MGVEVEGRCENILAPVCSSIGRVGLLLERSAMHLGTEETTRATLFLTSNSPLVFEFTFTADLYLSGLPTLEHHPRS